MKTPLFRTLFWGQKLCPFARAHKLLTCSSTGTPTCMPYKEVHPILLTQTVYCPLQPSLQGAFPKPGNSALGTRLSPLCSEMNAQTVLAKVSQQGKQIPLLSALGGTHFNGPIRGGPAHLFRLCVISKGSWSIRKCREICHCSLWQDLLERLTGAFYGSEKDKKTFKFTIPF